MRPLANYARRFGRLQRNARLYLISNALSGLTLGILLVLYNLYLASLGYKADFIGAVLFVGTIGAGLAIFPAGFCVDRIGGKLVMIVASLLIGIFGAGQILFRSPGLLLVSTFLVGVAGAAILVVNAPYLTANSEPEERAYLFSLNLVVTLITSVLGRVLGGLLPTWFRSSGWLMQPLPVSLNWVLASQSDARSYQLALLCAGLLAIPSFVPLFMLSSDRPARLERTSVAPRIREGNWRTSVRSLLTRVQGISWRSPVVTLTLVQGLIGLGAGLFIPYFNLYFVQHLGAPPWLFGLIDGAATGLTALATLAAPWLATRLGKPGSVVVTQLCSLPLLIAFGLTGLLPLALLLYPLRQATMDMSMGVLQVFSMESVPARHRGLANSSYQAAYQVAFAITTPLGGLLIVHSGYMPIFLLAALCYGLEMITIWRNFGGSKDDGGTFAEEAVKTRTLSEAVAPRAGNMESEL